MEKNAISKAAGAWDKVVDAWRGMDKSNRDAVASGVIGTGLGAGAGLGLGALYNKLRGREATDHALRNALLGATGGGLTMGALGKHYGAGTGTALPFYMVDSLLHKAVGASEAGPSKRFDAIAGGTESAVEKVLEALGLADWSGGGVNKTNYSNMLATVLT